MESAPPPRRIDAAAAALGLPRLAPARQPKLGERVAKAIQEEIIALGWPVGYNLGGEAELMKRHGVSRATLREAIRQVEHHGLALMRRGVNGGLVVQAPARSAAVATLCSYLHLIGITLDELFDAREVVELQAMRWAVARCRPQDIAALRQALAVYESATGFAAEAQACLRLRQCIAECGHNLAQLLPMEALSAITIESFPWHELPQLDPAAARGLRLSWAETAEAIATRDLRRAEGTALERLRLSRAALGQRLWACRAQTADDGTAASVADDCPQKMYRKLGHRLPQIICRDLAGRAQGERLGSEAELRQRFGISRSSFREAVRMLELHGIVTAQRGQTGGFVVGRADPGYTVELTTLYFRHSRPPARDCFQVWRCLMLAAIERSARRLDAGAAAELAEAVQRRRRALAEVCLPQPGSELMQVIVRHCGNRAIMLLAGVFGGLCPVHGGCTASRQWLDDMPRHQIAAAEAVLARDGAAARGHLESFLDGVGRWLEEQARAAAAASPAESVSGEAKALS